MVRLLYGCVMAASATDNATKLRTGQDRAWITAARRWKDESSIPRSMASVWYPADARETTRKRDRSHLLRIERCGPAKVGKPGKRDNTLLATRKLRSCRARFSRALLRLLFFQRDEPRDFPPRELKNEGLLHSLVRPLPPRSTLLIADQRGCRVHRARFGQGPASDP